MGIKKINSRALHLARFAAMLSAGLAVPLYGLSSFPLSDAARLTTELGEGVACCAGAITIVWKVTRKWLKSASKVRRWAVVLLTVLTVEIAGVVIAAGLIRYASLVTMAVMIGGLGLALAGGTWAFGGLLQWIWMITKPSESSIRHRRIVPLRSLHGGLSRG